MPSCTVRLRLPSSSRLLPSNIAISKHNEQHSNWGAAFFLQWGGIVGIPCSARLDENDWERLGTSGNVWERLRGAPAYYHGTTRLRDHGTVRPRDHETARPRDHETARQRDCETTGPLKNPGVLRRSQAFLVFLSLFQLCVAVRSSLASEWRRYNARRIWRRWAVLRRTAHC